MNRVWQKFLAKHLKINETLLALIGVFVKEVKNYTAEIYQQSLSQSFKAGSKHRFGTIIKERNSFSKVPDPLLFSV